MQSSLRRKPRRQESGQRREAGTELMFLGTWGSLPPWCPPTRDIQDVPLGYLCRGQKLGLELWPTVTSQGHEPPEAVRAGVVGACAGNTPACTGSVYTEAVVSGGWRDEVGDARMSPGLDFPDSSSVALLLPRDTSVHLFPGPLSPAPRKLLTQPAPRGPLTPALPPEALGLSPALH